MGCPHAPLEKAGGPPASLSYCPRLSFRNLLPSSPSPGEPGGERTDGLQEPSAVGEALTLACPCSLLLPPAGRGLPLGQCLEHACTRQVPREHEEDADRVDPRPEATGRLPVGKRKGPGTPGECECLGLDDGRPVTPPPPSGQGIGAKSGSEAGILLRDHQGGRTSDTRDPIVQTHPPPTGTGPSTSAAL